MILQERDMQALMAFADHHVMTARQLRALIFPSDTTGRITRRRLSKMVAEDYLRKRAVRFVSPTDGSPTPVFYLGQAGCEVLATYFDDDRYLLKPKEPLQRQQLFHYIAVTNFHMLLNEALSICSDVAATFVNEDEIVNFDEVDKSKHFRLFTELTGNKKIVCAPDGAMLLNYAGQQAVCYLEIDRDSYFHKRAAAQKSPGYEALLSRKLHRKHFPTTTLDYFFVLVVAPTEKRCRQLRKAFAETNANKSVQRIYRFMSLEKATPASIFFEEICQCCHKDETVALIKRQPTETTMVPVANLDAQRTGTVCQQ